MQIDTTGTGLRGYVTKGYTIEDIEKALRRAGASWRVHTGDDYNITTQIVTEIRGTTITIYDYKSTDEELADQVLGHYEWHVGGFRDQNAVAELRNIGIHSYEWDEAAGDVLRWVRS
tara:strand:+ start:607 stop:957 length:351 start_codon:yes stop_codon:yes gene_type:complete